MLLQFTVENVLSFRDRAVLSMLAVDGVPHSEQQVVRLPGLTAPVLKVAAVYGANASGKSNLVKALAAFRKLIAEGVRPGQSLGAFAFKLSAEHRSKPSRFEIELFLDGERWSYGIEVRPERVESEWLVRAGRTGKKHDEKMVFERIAGPNGAPRIEFGPGLKLGNERKGFVRFVADGTRHEQPFLSECAERNVGELDAVLGWFKGTIMPVRPDRGLANLDRYFAAEPSLLAYAARVLRESDTGVREIELQYGFTDTEQAEFPDTNSPLPPDVSARVVKSAIDGDRPIKLLFRSSSDSEVGLTQSEQSDGTIRLMHLAAILWSVKKSPQALVVVVDELDRSLHTLLARQLIQRFIAENGSSTSQLLFTTHDTNLLDLNLLPRDSIWFTEKDHSGASSLYSLAEFKPEQLDALGANLEQGYLQGRFGGIPFLGDARRLGWVDPS